MNGRCAKTFARSTWVALALASFGAVLGFTRPAAATVPRIVVVGREHDDPIVPRLRAELSALGFDVLEVPSEAVDSTALLSEQTRAHGAAAAVRIVRSGAGIEVWVVDRVTGKTSLRDVVVPNGPQGDADATIAIRAVELLRASLLEVHAPHASRGDVAPTEEIRAASELPSQAADARRSLFGVDLRVGAIASPGGVPATLALGGSAYWMPFGMLGFEGRGIASLTTSSIEAHEGRAQLSFGLAGGGARLGVGSSASTWAPSLSAGLAAAWLSARGTAYVATSASSPTALSAAPYLDLALAIQATSHVRAKIDLLGALATNAPQVQFVGRIVADWGRPILAPSAGVELAWP